MDIDTWIERLSAELGVADIQFDNDALHTVLDLARDAAHEVERMAAPLTTFLIGVAVGRGETLGASAAKATGLLLGLNGPATQIDGEADGDPDQAG
ncbi:DUF6457 domain-containing protein [Microlunatus ginsengisoli]|uniref:DUF6457 domain-containing protein n=1 Tax=Microlunatus ginsengisoli TaxID=363863 RepID=A0ABP7A7S1_9ACTN